MPEHAMVFDIQRFAVHDGPGIRTTVFLKGCTNRCGWCHNPESISGSPQLLIYQSRCAGCGACLGVCKTGALQIGPEGLTIRREKCNQCLSCTEVCNAQALVRSGKLMSAEEVLRIVLEDAPYYKSSGGGATISGGEPAIHGAFLKELLALLKNAGIHTAIETAGNYSESILEPFIENVDLVLFDFKAISGEIYRDHIGGDLGKIKSTLSAIDRAGVKIIARTPVVGGVNDSPEEIEAIARHLTQIRNLLHYQLIPYHALGKAKYDALSLPYCVPYYTPSAHAMAALEALAAKHVQVLNPKTGYI